MPTLADKVRWTDRKLLALPRDGKKYEVLAGELVVSPTGFQHGYISSRLLAAILDFALKHHLGLAVDSSTGFRMENGDCLSPDVSFVHKDRLPARMGSMAKFLSGAPDLAIEVISAGESRAKLREKLKQYFANGTRLTWIVYPKTRSVLVHRSVSRFQSLRAGESLNGEEVLPGFDFPVAELFEIPDFTR